MKNEIMKKLILLLTFYSLLISCNSDSNNSNNNNSVDQACQSQDFVTKFNSIPNNASYNDIKTIFGGVDGDNYRNDGSGPNSVLKYYKWYPCSDHTYYVDCLIVDNTQLRTKIRTIYNFSVCSNNISSTSFSSLRNGMTYNQVKTILNCNGDNYRVDYSGGSQSSKYYRFYNCSDTSKYIDVWFINDSVVVATKNY
jgi:hypothetical protein